MILFANPSLCQTCRFHRNFGLAFNNSQGKIWSLRNFEWRCLHSSAIQDWIIGQLQLQGLMETQNIMPSPAHRVTSKVVTLWWGESLDMTVFKLTLNIFLKNEKRNMEHVHHATDSWQWSRHDSYFEHFEKSGPIFTKITSISSSPSGCLVVDPTKAMGPRNQPKPWDLVEKVLSCREPLEIWKLWEKESCQQNSSASYTTKGWTVPWTCGLGRHRT